MSKLDDFFGKKKEIVPVLDLSKSTAATRDEFKRMIEKVPDYKMRPIKVRSDEIKFKDKDWSFKTPKKETKMLIKNGGERDRSYTYLDPTPVEMRNLIIMELCNVPIDWKMLTTQRPKTKVEEDYFSKLVEMGKLQIKSEARDKRENMLSASVRKVKNKSGIIESRIFSCSECCEEFCNGKSCIDFNYDLYTRVVPKAPIQKTNSQNQNSLNRLLMDINQKSNESSASVKKGRKGFRKKSKGKSKSTDDEGGGASSGGKKKSKKRNKSPNKSKSLDK